MMKTLISFCITFSFLFSAHAAENAAYKFQMAEAVEFFAGQVSSAATFDQLTAKMVMSKERLDEVKKFIASKKLGQMAVPRISADNDTFVIHTGANKDFRIQVLGGKNQSVQIGSKVVNLKGKSFATTVDLIDQAIAGTYAQNNSRNLFQLLVPEANAVILAGVALMVGGSIALYMAVDQAIACGLGEAETVNKCIFRSDASALKAQYPKIEDLKSLTCKNGKATQFELKHDIYNFNYNKENQLEGATHKFKGSDARCLYKIKEDKVTIAKGSICNANINDSIKKVALYEPIKRFDACCKDVNCEKEIQQYIKENSVTDDAETEEAKRANGLD